MRQCRRSTRIGRIPPGPTVIRAPGPIDSLAARKTLLAIIARRDPATARYAATFLVFTAPDAAARGAHVLVHRVDGSLISAGHLRLDDHAGAFTLHPVRGPRPHSVSVAERLASERLETAAAVAGRGEKRTDCFEGIPLHQLSDSSPARRTLYGECSD